MTNTTAFYTKLPEQVKDFFDRQYEDSYRLLDASRHPETGLYADSYRTLEDNPESKCSIAATGVGLIGLCVADMEGWDEKAAEKALVTINTALGKTGGCQPARDKQTGFFAHFVDMETGENLHSELSTIDTSLLVAGALFAGQHFKDTKPEIDALANELLNEIDWSVVVADIETGSINMVVKDGEGTLPLPAYNEYVLVAHLAMLGQPGNEAIRGLWHNNFSEEKMTDLPQVDFRGFQVLTDTNGEYGKDSFLSSFVHQFPFYLVPNYAESAVYREFYYNACMADRLKWKELTDVPSYVWGYGAGPNDGLHGGYHADQVNNSPGDIASAYIVGGFLPVYPGGIYDLYALYQNHLPYDGYTNDEDKEDERKLRAAYRYGLHRYSWWHLDQPDRWYPTKVTLIDWSSMLYGFTAFKRGMSFFTSRLRSNVNQ
ncbi:hypothetical protein GCM10007216_05470 [Thalassobacillus devorans]|uniref:Glycoamylase-like domain-containing protein n=1 Tax=Thalassobacillus devorans TaxID=279813 RepID=A0ABQ1NMB1_9BACI|nr:hypothetical protein [Thalassobacillus devorans]NIK27454.1 hypothetical protein [Thalassobacillus devorans]GGC77850.1 hypothetical protein GCM10007216_05470 [Thalassobacillus devorans]